MSMTLLWLLLKFRISIRNYAKCVVQDIDSNAIEILFRFDSTGYGTVPLHP